MKDVLKSLLKDAASEYEPLPEFQVERPKVKTHGQLSTNLALILSKRVGKKPQDLAQELILKLKAADTAGLIADMSVAGAGFINFTLKQSRWQNFLFHVLEQGEAFGRSHGGRGRKVLIEFVSANPTGPIHIGNARGGPLGDAIASLLEATGCEVVREFYVNDIGGQTDKLGYSMLLAVPDEVSGVRVTREKEGKPVEAGYQGEYVRELAVRAFEELKGKIPADEAEAARILGRYGIDQLMNEIRRDCEAMGIHFQSWIHEKQVLALQTDPILKKLKSQGATVEKEGAVWLSGQAEGAEENEFLKDRECVLVRSDGRPTYFANDIAYHAGKYDRGFDRLINVWGSNHHGHVPRVQAAMKYLGYDPNLLETVLYQYVRVRRGADAVKMSKRAGNFVTAEEVLSEVGKDAFRFFLLMRAPESHLDFDLELARKHSQENPVYYVQYAHARLASIERKAKEMNLENLENLKKTGTEFHVADLNRPEEIELIQTMSEFPEEVERAAAELAPHRIAFYLLELSKLFQAYYAKAKDDDHYRVLAGSVDSIRAKRYLCAALKLTIAQGLRLLGVSAPEVMQQEN